MKVWGIGKGIKTPTADEANKPHAARPVETVADDTEMLRQRAMERIAKLRKLSFNQSSNDTSNEYEDVPAYMRRNLELDEPIANVETFYSNYTVKNDDKKQADINTINTFLDGKKPA